MLGSDQSWWTSLYAEVIPGSYYIEVTRRRLIIKLQLRQPALLSYLELGWLPEPLASRPTSLLRDGHIKHGIRSLEI